MTFMKSYNITLNMTDFVLMLSFTLINIYSNHNNYNKAQL